MNTTDYIILNLCAWAILIYKLKYTYWIKWVLFKPWVTKSKWQHISLIYVKPFDCYGCMVLWSACIIAYYTEPHTFRDISTHICKAFLPALLIQTHIER